MLPHRAIILTLCADWDWPHDNRYLTATPIFYAAGITLYPVLMRGYARLVNGFVAKTYRRTVPARSTTR
jgi:hypothetical protein